MRGSFQGAVGNRLQKTFWFEEAGSKNCDVTDGFEADPGPVFIIAGLKPPGGGDISCYFGRFWNF